MKSQIFKLGFASLVNAFSYAAEVIRDSEAMQRIYWEELKDIPDRNFEAGIKWCLHHSKFFPSIAELGAACFDGNEHWHERIVESKRLATGRKFRRLEPPRDTEERKANQKKIVEIIRQVEVQILPRADAAVRNRKNDIYKEMIASGLWSDQELVDLAAVHDADELERILAQKKGAA